MSEETDKMRLQAIIAQNKVIMDKLTVLTEWVVKLNTEVDKLNLTPMPKDDDPEGVYYAELPEDVPSDIIVEKGLPKPITEEKDQGISIPTKDLPLVGEIIEDEIEEVMKPKKRITSADIVGTCKDKPKQEYTVYLIGEETDLAVKVKHNDMEAWLAKSAIYGTYKNVKGIPQAIWVREWIIKRNFTPEEKE